MEIVNYVQFSLKSSSKSAKKYLFYQKIFYLLIALETECILRPNQGTSADVPDVPSRTSMVMNHCGKIRPILPAFCEICPLIYTQF